jgi:hypothetical protein
MPDTTLPNRTLEKLASQARLKPFSDIKQEIPDWGWADEYAQSVLDRLAPIDDAWVEESERKKAENRAKRTRISTEKKANATTLPLLLHDRQWLRGVGAFAGCETV